MLLRTCLRAAVSARVLHWDSLAGHETTCRHCTRKRTVNSGATAPSRFGSRVVIVVEQKLVVGEVQVLGPEIHFNRGVQYRQVFLPWRLTVKNTHLLTL